MISPSHQYLFRQSCGIAKFVEKIFTKMLHALTFLLNRVEAKFSNLSFINISRHFANATLNFATFFHLSAVFYKILMLY
jgi:hypothetical protein